MSIERVREENRHIVIKDIYDDDFRNYGRVLDQYDFTEVIEFVRDNAPIGMDGNIYVPSLPELEALSVCRDLQNGAFGGMDIQAGYCTGRNSALNGLEYHKSSEIDVAVTDLVLLLGRVQGIHGNTYESSNVEAFYVPEGAAVELYATTLHFAPCKISPAGFKAIIILPQGTNQPLKNVDKRRGEAELLFMKNKWLLVHPSMKALVEKGAYPGILGDNIGIICP